VAGPAEQMMKIELLSTAFYVPEGLLKAISLNNLARISNAELLQRGGKSYPMFCHQTVVTAWSSDFFGRWFGDFSTLTIA